MAQENNEIIEKQVDQEREDIVNKPVVDVPNIESNKPKLDTSESAYWAKQLDIASMFKESATVGYKNAERKERDIRYNQKRIDPTRVKQFKKFLTKALTQKHKKPDIVDSIFQDNKITIPTSQGFTKDEMALAWLQHFDLHDSVTLGKMKTRIKSWIEAANIKHDSRIHGTEVEKGVVRYHITKRNKDFNSQINKLDEFKTNIGHAEDKRKAEAEQVKREQKENDQIVIDVEGQPVAPAAEEMKEDIEGGETQ